MTVRVPGKVNLYLGVGVCRDDGYHELTTVFHAVSLFDEITVRNADVLSLELSGEGDGDLPNDRRNLAWQAAELLAEHVGRAPDVAISVEKSIPVAGGMAGGSADAAGVLVAVNALWELGVPRRDLARPCRGAGQRCAVCASRRHRTRHGTWGTAGNGVGPQHLSLGARLCRRWARRRQACSPNSTGCAPTPTAEQPPWLDDPEPLLAALASGDATQLAPLLGNDLQAAAVSLDSRDCVARFVRAIDAGALAGWCPVPDPRAPFCAAPRRRPSTSAFELAGEGVCRTVRAASGPVHGARVVPTPSRTM